MAPRSIEDIRARADEFADAFENYDPKPGETIGTSGEAACQRYASA